MSDARDESERVARRYCEAWIAGDLPAILDCYHDDLTLHYFGRNPLSGDHRGKPRAVAALVRIQQRTNRQLLAIEDVLVSKDRAMVIARERWERDGRAMELQRLLVYRIKDGKLAECWVYDADQQAVDEFLA